MRIVKEELKLLMNLQELNVPVITSSKTKMKADLQIIKNQYVNKNSDLAKALRYNVPMQKEVLPKC